MLCDGLEARLTLILWHVICFESCVCGMTLLHLIFFAHSFHCHSNLLSIVYIRWDFPCVRCMYVLMTSNHVSIIKLMQCHWMNMNLISLEYIWLVRLRICRCLQQFLSLEWFIERTKKEISSLILIESDEVHSNANITTKTLFTQKIAFFITFSEMIMHNSNAHLRLYSNASQRPYSHCMASAILKCVCMQIYTGVGN